MLDIPLFVLVLQIGLSSALNIRGYYRDPSPRSLYPRHTRQTRREDVEKQYLGYSAPDYETTLESAPLNKPALNNYVKKSLPSPVVRRRYWGRAPYLQQKAPSFSQPQRRNPYSGINDYLTSYANSLTVTKHDNDDNMLHSLVSLISQLGNDDKTRKYNRKDDNISLEEISYETSNSEEDIDSSFESSGFNNLRSYYFRQQPSYKRHNYRKGYNDNRYDLQIRRTPAKDTSDEVDGILVTDDSKPYDVVTIAGPTLKESELIINRNDNQDSDTDDVLKYRKKGMPYITGLKHIVKKSKHYTKSNKDIDREVLLNAKLLRNTDNTDQFTKLRLSSSEENFDSQRHGNKIPNNNYLRFLLLPKNTLTLGSEVVSNITNVLSTALGKVIGKLNFKPDLRTVVDTSYNDDKRYNTGGAETHGFSQNVNLRSYDDTSLMKRLLVDKADSNLVPYHEFKDHNNGNKEIDSNEEFGLDTDNDEDTALVGLRSLNIDLPLLEINSALRTDLDTEELAKKFMNILQLALSPNVQLSIEKDKFVNKTENEENREATTSSGKSSNKTIDTSDEFSLDDTDFTSLRTDELTNSDTVSSTDKLHVEYSWDGQLSTNDKNKNNDLRTEISENYTDEHLGYPSDDQQSSSSEYVDNTLRSQKAEYFTDILHLEHPWTDELSPENENISHTLRSQKPEEYIDELHLEYPWNDQPNADNEDDDNSLRTQTSSSDIEVGDAADSTNLSSHLEFPWNGKLSPNKDDANNALRAQNMEDFTDVLHVEYPWTDELSPDSTNLNNALRNQKSQTDKRVTDAVDSTSVLHLDYPWNGLLSPDNDSVNIALRTQNFEDSADVLHLEYPWNSQLSSDNENKTKSLRTQKSENSTYVLDFEFPWNGQRSSDDNKNDVHRAQKSEDSTDVLQLEYSWNGQLRPDNENKTKALRTEKSENSTDELHLEFPWNDQLRPGDDNEKDTLRTQNLDDFTNLLHLEYPWNGQQKPDNEKNLLTSRKLNTKLRRKEEKYIAREYTDVVDLEFPWNEHSSPERNKRKLRSESKPDKGKELKNYNTVLEYPWNGGISQDEENVGKKAGSKNKQSHLRKRNKRPGHYSRSTYHDDSDDLTSRRALSKAVKHLEKQYDDLKKFVLKLPGQKKPEKKTAARTNSRTTGDSHLHNQLLDHTHYNYNRRVQDDEEAQQGTCLPTSQEDLDKIEFPYKSSDEDEDSSDSVTFPLDRRPDARLTAHHKDEDTDRRSDLLLQPTDKPTDPLFNTTNDIESELKNDTVNYVLIVD